MNDCDHLVSELVNLEPIKTWSLIVTLFGDLHERRLSGKDIRTYLAPIGIKPEAARVALHRLKKEGWVRSEKSGREVLYDLTEFGRSETMSASEDIYRRDAKYSGAHVLVVADRNLDIGVEPHCRIGEQIVVVPAGLPLPLCDHIKITLPQTSAPRWFHDGLAGQETLDIATKLGAIAASIDTSRLAPHIRLLMLHRWRKFALRPAVWMHIALFPQGSLAVCHRNVSDVLAEN